MDKNALRIKCPYSELFWSVFSGMRTEYGKIRSISPYSVRMRENTDQDNSEYGLFLCSDVECLRCNEVETLGYFQLSDVRYYDSNEVNERVGTTVL